MHIDDELYHHFLSLTPGKKTVQDKMTLQFLKQNFKEQLAYALDIHFLL